MAQPSDPLYARGFAADNATWRALRAGFEGHKAKLQKASLAVALRTLAVEPASKLLFVDLDGVTDPDAAGRDLAAVCALETAVFAIGSIDTAQYTRALFQYGIADYLVKPITATIVREACASVTDDVGARSYAGRVIAFSGNAGSGTSTLVAAIAHAVAAERRTVSVVDLDRVSGRLPALLGAAPADDLSALLAMFDSDQKTVSEPGIAPARLDSVCVPAGEGISLIAYAPAEVLPPSPSTPAVLRLLGHMANRTHVVLATGFTELQLRQEVIQQADARVLLYEPTLASLSSAVHCLALLGAKYPATLVQCYPRVPKSSLSPAHIRYAMGDRSPDVVIPFDPALHAAAIGETAEKPGKAYGTAVRQVLDSIVDSTALVAADDA